MIKRGDPQPSGYTWRWQTLEKVHKAGAHLRIGCDDCGRTIIRSPVWFATICGVPWDTTVYELAQRLTCHKCGGRHIQVDTAADD